MNTILQTPRLFLRQFTMDDAELILQLSNAPGVLRYIHEPRLENIEHAENVMQTILLPQYERQLGRWAVHTKHNNEFIGWCGLKWLQETNEIDLGYRYFPATWGNGYATEAAQHTLQYGFNHLHLPEIIGRAHIENIASQNVLQKIGMLFLKDATEDNVPIKIFRTVNPQ